MSWERKSAVGHIAIISPDMANQYLNFLDGLLSPLFSKTIPSYSSSPEKFQAFDMTGFAQWYENWTIFYRKERNNASWLNSHMVYHAAEPYEQRYDFWRNQVIAAGILDEKNAPPKPAPFHSKDSGDLASFLPSGSTIAIVGAVVAGAYLLTREKE